MRDAERELRSELEAQEEAILTLEQRKLDRQLRVAQILRELNEIKREEEQHD